MFCFFLLSDRSTSNVLVSGWMLRQFPSVASPCVSVQPSHSQLSIFSRHNITHHSRTTDTKDYARTSLHRRFSALILNFSIFLSGNFLSISTSKQSDRPAEVISSLNANMTPESCSSSDNFGLTRSSRGSVHSSEKNCRFAIVDLIYRELRAPAKRLCCNATDD